MKISFDPAKSTRNVAERGLSFDLVSGFDFVTARFRIDDRRDYGEPRWRALGLIDGRLHALVFTPTTNGIRIISFRKANAREVKNYEEAGVS